MNLLTKFATPDKSPGFLLWQASSYWQQLQTKALLPFDLTHAQLVLLATTAWFSKNGASPSQADIAVQARMNTMMASQVLRTLERKRLIKRKRNPADSRAFCITPTEKGVVLVNQALPEVERIDHEFFSSLRDRQALFTELLTTLKENCNNP